MKNFRLFTVPISRGRGEKWILPQAQISRRGPEPLIQVCSLKERNYDNLQWVSIDQLKKFHQEFWDLDPFHWMKISYGYRKPEMVVLIIIWGHMLPHKEEIITISGGYFRLPHSRNLTCNLWSRSILGF
mgnify:CR=1 FL=1